MEITGSISCRTNLVNEFLYIGSGLVVLIRNQEIGVVVWLIIDIC